MEYVVFCLLGYLFGSVTFGYLIPRLIKGVDVRALSSDGNPGTANAFLYGGVFSGILVLLAVSGKRRSAGLSGSPSSGPGGKAFCTGNGGSGGGPCLSAD